MATSEGSRHDLYNGLVAALGEKRARTLMAYLPSVESTDQLTRGEFHREMSGFRDELRSFGEELHGLRQDLNALDDRLSKRLDRLYITLVTGLFVIVASMLGVFAATLA